MDIPEIAPNLINSPLCKKLIKYYGLTTDPFEAFFILPDGKLLDGSGRSQGNKHRGDRTIDHHEVNQFVKVQLDSPYSTLLYILEESGMIRFDYHADYLSVVNKPNQYQIKTILKVFHGMEVQIDYYGPKQKNNGFPPLASEFIISNKEQLEWFFKYPEDSLSGYKERTFIEIKALLEDFHSFY